MLPAARRTLLQGLKVTAALADRIRPPDQGMVILLYHRVGGGSGLEMDLPTYLFTRQIEALAQKRVIPLPDALSLLSRGEDAHPDGSLPVVVTFDDGTADFVDTALPLLVQHRIPTTLYVATRFIDERSEFPRGGRPASWAALREAVSTGFVTIGSHTHSHALLDRVVPIEAEAELRRSIDLIGEHLDVVADHFAYPKAILPPRPKEAVVRRLFVSASLGGNRANIAGRTDLFRLSRSPIQASDGMRWFKAKRAGGLALEERVRQALNVPRYRRTRK